MTRGGGNSNQRLSSKNPWAYLGNNSYQPPEFVTETVAPTTEDAKNFSLGTVWLVVPVTSGGTDPLQSDIYFLVKTYDSSGDPNGAWVPLSGGVIEALTGNSGGPVARDIDNNINIVGNGTTINIVGDPSTNTLTMSVVSVETLTGNSGGAVGPTASDITVVGSGVFSVVGDPGTSTLTVTPDGSIASSFITSPATGTATPAAGVLTFAGTDGVVVTNASSTATIDGSALVLTVGFTADDANTVTPTADDIIIAGGTNLTTTGTVGPNTLTVHLDSITQYTVQVGGASNDLTQIANGTNGQVFTAATGADPGWADISASIDYEQGTFNPLLRFGGAGAGITYDTNRGDFWRIDDAVWYIIYIKLTSKGGGGGDATIIQLPYNAVGGLPPFWDSSTWGGVGAGTFGIGSGHTKAWISVRDSGKKAFTRTSGSGVTQRSLNNTDFNNTSEFRITGFYQRS